MVLYVDKKYQDSSYVFPDYKIDPEKKKEKQYAFKNTVAIYSTHLRGKSGVPFNQLDNWAKQRLYGIGDQDRDQYVTKLMGEDESNTTTLDLVSSTGEVFNTKEERRKGWENINKQIVSVASKIKDVYHGMFDEQDYNVSVDAIDENSGAAVEDAKLKLYANVLWAKELNKMRVNAELPDPAFSFAPKDLTELELYESAGGFKMNYAKAMEKLLKFSFSDGDWGNTLKIKLLDDALDIGYVAAREDVNNDTGRVEPMYLDPSRLIMQYSEEYDYENSEWGGYYRGYTVSQLAQCGFDKDYLKTLAHDYCGYLGNPSRDSWVKYSEDDKYYNFKIPVLECEWIDTDIEKEIEKEDGEDRVVEDVPFDYEPKGKEKLREKKIRQKYRAKWIIGTKEDGIFDYGLAYDQLRPTPSKPILSFRMVKITDNPIMKRLIPIFDQMQIAWLRYQNAMVISSNAGYAINVRLLQNITLGGQKLTFKDVFKIMRNNGTLFYSDTPAHGQYTGGAVNPVTPLPSMFKDMIEEAQMEFEYSIRYVEHLTGLTPVALGGTPDPKALKSTTELSYSATQNVMRPIVGGIMALKQRISESIVLRTQMLLKNNEEARKAYTRIIGKIDVQAMLTAEQNNVAYGLMLKPQPDAGERERIYNMLTEAMALGRDGVKSIELDDALMIEEMLDKKMDLTEIRMLLSYKIRKYKEEKRAEAIQGQQIEAQKNERLEQVKAQNKAKDEQAEWERKKAELMLEKQSEERQLNIEHNNRLREDVMKYAHEEDMQERELKAENNG